MKEFSVIIPVYNEEKNIERILEDVKKIFDERFEVIVVNDGSTDNTGKILEKFKNDFKIINHKKNYGKGMALRTGINNSSGKWIGIQDADFEYNMRELKGIFELAKKRNLDAIFGSRFKKKNPVRYIHYFLGNFVMSSLISILFLKRITDSYTCYKVIKSEILKKLNLKSLSFEIEAEITSKLLKNGIKITEIPISYIPRSIKEGKKIKFKDAIKGIITIFKVFFS